MRHYVIAGNWKMNKNPAEAAALIVNGKLQEAQNRFNS